MLNFNFFQKKIRFEFVLFIFSLTITIISLNFPFYWDNIVQISIPANWYFNTNFKSFFIPDIIATGHPTFVAMYFTILWEIFGRTLWVSHIGMLPFIFGLTIQINQLIKNLYIEKKLRILILLFVFIDTSVLSQISLITFDVFHLFFYFLCINSILKNKKTVLTIAFLCLVLVSLRGTISGIGILLFHFMFDYSKTKRFKIKIYINYLLGIIGIITFLLFFYIEKNWIIHNTVSNAWKESAEFASPIEILRNIGVFIWRLIDFGRVAIFILFAFFIFQIIKKRGFENKSTKTLFLIIISQFIVFFPIIIIYRNPFGHRYLLPIIIPSIILVVYWINQFKKNKQITLVIMFFSLISGHFWLYPEKIAQGWDASTIHWNYFHVRQQMLTYLNNNSINIAKVGTFFPNTSSLQYIDLDSNDIRFKDANIKTDSLILYSNAFNVEDKFIDNLMNENRWTVVKEFKSNRIYIKLYKKI